MENKKNQISKNVKTMVDIRILEGTRDLRNFPYETIGHTVYEDRRSNILL
jgi:hypothetical protein